MRIGAGRFKGRRLPEVGEARPVGARLKKSLFDVLGSHLEAARVLDIFAGTGAFGLEALSRGAAHATFVDHDAAALDRLRAWLERVGVAEEGQCLRLDLARAPLPPGPFDLIFLDPPFEWWQQGVGAALIQAARERLAPTGMLVVKRPRPTAIEAHLEPGLLRRVAAGDVEACLFGPV
jgi:16S rRNA (guanine966-N2)-methyltransferase